MRELGGPTLRHLIKDQQPHIHVHPLLDVNELEKRIPLAAQTSYCAELEELQELLHFPEEVALRLADTEYQLFYQVPPIDYLRQVTLDLGGAPGTTADSLPGNSSARSSVATLIKRFNEVSAWVTQLIISQPTHDARRAVLSCVLRVALSCWNIGNFNGAMEIIAGLKSNKLKPFWLSITEKETLPVLDFLSAALLSAEYDRALSRALAMAECPVVPFFGAFLRELREILASGPPGHDLASGADTPPPKPPKADTRRDRDQQLQQRQVFISDYNGEDHHFTKIGPGGLINLEKIYRTQAVMDHISLCHQHYHTRNRLSPTVSLIEYLKSSNTNEQRVLAAAPPQRTELDAEYDCDVDDYHPVQPLVHDHGVSFVCLSSPFTKIDQHVMQILHHGSTVVLWEGVEGPSPPGLRGVLLYLRLDRSSTTLTWVRPSWSGLKAGNTNDSDPFSTDFNLSFNPEDTLAPGLLTKLALQASGEQSTGTTLDDGFLDLTAVKEVHLGGRDAEKEAELGTVARRYGLNHEEGNECALTILYGYGLSDNRLLYVVCPAAICRVWFSGLSWLIRGLSRQSNLSDRRLLWLREQYMQLYHEDGYCCGPLAADAIRSFGGRDWSLAGMTASNQIGEPSGALRREVSMKIKKKQLLSNQTFKDRSLRSQFVEPATMCMESSYWRNPAHHRQSTPTTFPDHHSSDVSRHHSLGQLAYNSSQPKFDRDRHGSTEHLWHGRHPRVGSILYDTQLDFVDFVTLFRSFSLLIRKDLRDLFEQLAISYRSMAVNTSTKVNGVKAKIETKKVQKLGLLTRNSRGELEGSVVNSQKKIFDAIAAASIFTNCAGIDTNNSQVITMSTFTKFLETRQMEVWTEEQVKALIYRHESDATLRAQNCLSFEGFARYLMDKDNYAFVNEREVPNESDMVRPMSTYYIASSHNTYLTGHQLKGESSVELYSQVLLTGCRCVELDCWDGDDGFPMIYHGHTFTTKIPFNAVVETIDRNAFVTSPYPVILSIENHCSLQQQTRMAHVFQRVFGEKLVTNFLFETDYSDEPSLPSPEQLKHRILIKNKKLIMEVPAPLSFATMSTPGRPGSGIRHSVPGRTSSIISNTSSSSFNDDFSDDEYDDEDDEDNIDEKTMHGILTANESPRPYGVPHTASKTSSTKRAAPDDKLKKRSSQISKDLSDIVVYIQMESSSMPLEAAAKALNISIPTDLRNVLTANSYTTVDLIARITEKDIEDMETFCRETLHLLINEDELESYFGIFAKKVNLYRFTAGNRKIINLLIEFSKKQMNTPAIKESRGQRSSGQLKRYAGQPDPNTIAKKIARTSKETEEETNEEQLDNQGSFHQNVNVTQESSIISRALKAWTKRKCTEEQWKDIGNKFDNIEFSTSASHTSNENSNIVCHVTCFCKASTTIYKVAKNKNFQKRWIYTNFHRHFIGHHLKLDSKVQNDSKGTSARATDIRQFFTGSSASASTSKKPTTVVTGQDSIPSQTQKSVPLEESVTSEVTSGVEDQKQQKVTVISNILLVKGETECSEEVSDRQGDRFGVETEINSKSLQDFSRSPNEAFLMGTIMENVSQPPSAMLDFSQSPHEASSMGTITKNFGQPSSSMQNVSGSLHGASPMRTVNENFGQPSSMRESDLESVTKPPTLVPDQSLSRPSSSRPSSSRPSSTNWQSTKYQRKQRRQRRREQTAEKQTLLTDFFPVLQEVQSVIDNNPNLASKLMESIESSSHLKSASNLLQMLYDISLQNCQHSSNKNQYDDVLKKFCIYIYYIGGRLLYETLQANLKNIIPGISSLTRYIANHQRRLQEGVLDYEGLNLFLEERNLGKYVWISEDATRITGKIEYDPNTNQIVGFTLPLENGVPVTGSFIASSAKAIQKYFTEETQANYAYTIMAQPLCNAAPPYCLTIFGTDNRFTHEDVMSRWALIRDNLNKLGITVVGFSTDGDTRCLKTMRINSGLPTKFDTKDDHFNGWEWFSMNYNWESPENSPEISPSYIQDAVHIATKLRTKFLKPSIVLPLGNFTASLEHLQIMISRFSKDQHKITISDLKAEDKMNFQAAAKMCDPQVQELLKQVDGSDGTRAYLKCMNYATSSFLDKSLSISKRLYCIWYAIFFLRIWKKWVITSPNYTLKDHFITSNCYTCIELNGHHLIKLILTFQKNNWNSEMFLPWLFSSQTCEAMFRALRSMTSTFCTVVNFSIKDMLHRSGRIQMINNITNDLEGSLTFPRENKKKNGSPFKNSDDLTLMSVNQIEKIINSALSDCLTDTQNLGMYAENWNMTLLPQVIMDDPVENVPLKESLEESDELDDEEEHSRHGNSFTETIEYTLLENNLNRDIEEEEVQTQQHSQDDLLLDLEKIVSDAKKVDDLLVKDFSSKFPVKSDLLASNFVRISLTKDKSKVIKKSTLCWLLQQDKERISTDRLRRFINSNKKPNQIKKSRAKNTPTKKTYTQKACKRSRGKDKHKTTCKLSTAYSSSSTSLSTDVSTDDMILESELEVEEFSENSSENDGFPDNQANTNDDKIVENDYVLVQFPTKTKKMYYVGKVVEVKPLEFRVRFLRRKGLSYTFFFPTVLDESVVDKSDIIAKLPAPNTSLTARTASILQFQFNFANFNNVN